MTVDWAGSSWELLTERALYWPSRSTLILSDLHLGKAEHFQAAGIPVPSAIHHEDLARLGSLVETLKAERVFVLGDFVHSNRESHDDLAEAFQRIRGGARWILALGNHDWHGRERLSVWRFDEIVREIEKDGIVFCHDESKLAGPRICGHIHPAVLLGQGRDRVRLPCFVFGKDRLLLPAFGAFTGGYNIEAKRSERVFAVADEGIFAL